MRAIELNAMRRACLNCGGHFEALTPRAEYCSGRCRAEASRKRRDRERTAALDEVERALRRVRRLLWHGERESVEEDGEWTSKPSGK